MPKSLHARLALALLALLLIFGVAQVFVTLETTDLHLQEVSQSMQLGLAAHLAKAKEALFLDEQGQLSTEGLSELFHWLMVVNPGVEFYLLDHSGELMAYDAPAGVVQRSKVSLEPIRTFLGRQEHLPILGDDPRHPTRRKIFSVAPLPAASRPGEPVAGYLYIVLASEQFDSAVEWLQSSYILRLGSGALLAALALTAIAGFLLFRRLTRPLRQLVARMEAFRDEWTPQEHKASNASAALAPGGEVELLTYTFDRMASRIREQVEELQRVESHRRELIANVSHDLRTPIASLQGYLETMVLKRDSLQPSERDEYLGIAMAQSERLGRLVQELFDLTRLDHRAVELRLEAFSLAELVQDNLQRYQLQAEACGVNLQADMVPKLPQVMADLGLMERVLQNLLENALRWTPRNGTITVHLTPHSSGVRVQVADTGRGIPSDALPHVFDRFYRLPQPEPGQHESTGLGLAITKRILELHDSRIEVQSQPGEGTTFTFALRAAA